MCGAISSWLSSYRDALAAHSSYGYTVLRWSLGVTMFLSGFHKLFHPALWGSYMAAEFALVLPVEPGAVMRFVHAPVEITVGLLVLADRHTSFASSVAALSMTTIVFNLMVAGATVDILVRDIGILGLAISNALIFAGESPS